MKSRDIISSLFWMATGIGISYGGYDLEVGNMHDPGSGFMFFWVGIIMIGLTLIILIKAVREKGVQGELNVLWKEIRWKKVISVLASLFLYAYLLNTLGFILTTILLLIFLFKAVEPQKWSWAILGAIICTLTAYGLFHFWLGCQLPQGLLGA
ncbi:MAG: tripartite tricarboxylate transporter TctB family protein [Deltaproteobacteria bacterium]|nr:tripartite tricarboxylate transporter TctB family protein [Deltaproteobacteria bacterium]